MKKRAAGDEGEEVRFASALNLLRLARHRTDAIGVAVSFGKDSLATLDLACRVFTRVEAYYLYRVAGLAIVDQWAAQVRERHGVTVRMYPHFDLARCYRNAVLQPHWKDLDKTPAVKMADIETVFRKEASVQWIAYGWRRNDSFSRALIMRKCAGYDPGTHRVFPLRSWRRQDVYSYLDQRGIPRPPKLGRAEQGGLDFHPEALAGLSPEDWAKWERDFPFSAMQLRQARAAQAPEGESERASPARRSVSP